MLVRVAQLAPAISTVFLFCSHDGMIQYSSSFAAQVLCSSVPSLQNTSTTTASAFPITKFTRAPACASARPHVFQSKHVIALEWP